MTILQRFKEFFQRHDVLPETMEEVDRRFMRMYEVERRFMRMYEYQSNLHFVRKEKEEKVNWGRDGF
jgi:hypothetical protein